MFYFSQFLMWGGWLLLPIILEIIKNIVLYVKLIKKSYMPAHPELDHKPLVSILIPVYNSSKTLKLCLDSLLTQTYGLDNIEVFLLNNGGNDGSYEIFSEFQAKHSQIRLWWLDTGRGKAAALNKGLFNCSGKYIVNIDSDGWLDRNAITNIVKKFEFDNSVSALTGVVLTDPVQIDQTKNWILRGFQKAEFIEYTEAFLIGRNHQSEQNNLYTLAGAFSAFKKEAILKTQLYNSQTLGEDTHMTLQIKKFVGGKIILCEDAFLFVDPIESFDKMYTQRQRWQRSTVEIALMFKDFHTGKPFDLFKKVHMRILILDHTIAFINLFWTFSFIYFYFVGYPLVYFIYSHVILYGVYVLNSVLYNRVSLKYLKTIPNARNYLKKLIFMSFYMVPYRTLIYLIRLAGLINSTGKEATWTTTPLSEEIKSLFHLRKKTSE